MENSLTRIVQANGSPWLPDAQQLQRLLQLSGYGYDDASRSSQSGATWWTNLFTADEAILPKRLELIARSRDLTRNNPIGRGTKKLYLDSVVGEGLIPSPQPDVNILGLDIDQKRQASAAILSEFFFFADDVHCDLQRETNFYGKQRQAYAEYWDAGDCLVVLPRLVRPGNPFETKIQIIESEGVTSGYDDAYLNIPGNNTVAGVRKDIYGAPVGYQYREPGEGAYAKLKEVQAFGPVTGRRIAWLMKNSERVHQTRGVPYLACTMATIHDLGRLQKGELLSSIVNGLFTAFVKSPPGSSNPLMALALGQQRGGVQDIGMGYANVVNLNPGQEVTMAHSAHPNSNYAPYFNSQVDLVAMGLGMPAEVARRKFEQSYSASRAALLEAWRSFLVERFLLVVQHFCQPIYEAVIWESVLRGRLTLPGFLEDERKRRAWLYCQWRGAPRGSIDPLKEVMAAKERIGLGISNREKETIEYSGEDWWEIEAQAVIEAEQMAKDGLIPVAGSADIIADPAAILKADTAKDSIVNA